MGNYKALVLTEDWYGIDFFERVIKRLKREGLIEKSKKIEIEWLYGKCNAKLRRVLNAKTVIPPTCIVVVVADAEGGNRSEVIQIIEQHIPTTLKDITQYVIFNYCIEEWICEGLGIKWRGRNPVECLNKYLREKKSMDYEKYMLPDFAEKIDINKLLENNKEFNEFLESISS